MAVCGILQAKEYWIWLLSVFYMLVAIVLVAFGIISLEATGELLTEVDLVAPSMAATVVAILLIAVSLVGFYAGTRVYYNVRGKGVVFPSALFVAGSFLLTLVLLAAGIALLRYRRFMEEVANNEFKSIGERILTYELAVFEECCSPIAASPESCEENGFIYPCIADTDLYNTFLELIGDDTCSYFEGSDITSATDPEGCGGQQISPFIPIISGFLYGQMTIMGAINISLSLILMCMTTSIALSLKNLGDYESTREAADTNEQGHIKYHGGQLTTDFSSPKDSF